MNPWNPTQNKLDLKHLGKLVEEVNELGAATARCVIQGIEECEPVTGKSNRVWLQEEIADVEANIELVKKHFKLDREFILTRVIDKMSKLFDWHRM